MSSRIDDEGLRLVLDEIPPRGNPELERAVAWADADVERIRLGLGLVAQELPEASPAPGRPNRPLWRVAVAAAVAAAVSAAVLGAIGVLPGTRSSAPPSTGPAHFVPDRFDYRPGGDFARPAPPALSYSVPLLAGVAASSSRDAWIVGSTGRRGIAWRWDGTAWRSVPLPSVPGLNLASVTAVDDGEAWTVGWHSGYRMAHAVIEHWDGLRWRLVPAPYAGPSNLLSVSASGSRDVWAAGASFRRDRVGRFPAGGTRPLLLHWDGSTWSTVTLPWARPGLVLAARVVTTGPTDVWVVVSGVSGTQVEHWDGESWRAVRAPFGQHDFVWGFSATSADDAWAVGSYRRAGHSRTLAAHWDGRTWQIAPTPNRGTDSSLTDVVALRPDDVWAVGQSGRAGLFAVALFEHWDGRSWHVMPGATPQVWDGGPTLSATEDGSAWAVGSCYFDNVVAHWNGSAWQIVPHPPDQEPRPAHGRWVTCSPPATGS
jgi:hypothetical protein